MQAPGVDFKESLPLVTSDTSTRILIELTLYYEDDELIEDLCDMEMSFLHPNT